MPNPDLKRHRKTRPQSKPREKRKVHYLYIVSTTRVLQEDDKLGVFIYRAIMLETMMVNQDNGHVNAVGLMLYYVCWRPNIKWRS